MSRVLTIETADFGTTSNGEAVTLYTMKGKKGMSLSVCDYGATLVSIKVADKDGQSKDVVLGYDDVSSYEKGTTFFGATVGRNANRIGKAVFTLNGKTCRLDKNDGNNNLHSGNDYYNKRMWEVRSKSERSITFSLHSKDGDQGYPGALDMEVTYSLTPDEEVKIEYRATSNEDTIINMTNHSYFNLNGHNSGDVLSQQVWIDADYYTPSDKNLIPTGEIVPVKGTPMDFTEKKAIGRDIEADHEAIKLGGGYDHNWALNNRWTYQKVAEMSSDQTGIIMEVYSDLSGMQFYTGNFLTTEAGKEGATYGKRSGACFETQFFPDAINHENFESPVCKAGDPYKSTTVYKFTIEG